MSTCPLPRQRVLLAEDCPSVRRSVKALLERDAFDVVGEAGDGNEAVQMAASLKPDVVVLDRAMPRVDGFQAAGQICRMPGAPHLVLLSIHVAAHHVLRGMQVGIRGFVSKQDAGDELARALTEVANGRMFLSAAPTRAMRDAGPGLSAGMSPQADS